MKSERYFKKNLIKKISKGCLYGVFAIIVLTFTMGFYYEPNIYLKLNDVTVELGDPLPAEITEYRNLLTSNDSNLAIETSAPLDEHGNTTVIGKFNYYLVYKDNNYMYSRLTNVKSTITVIDTIDPIITLKEDVEIKYDGDFSPEDVAECFDLSGCKLEVKEKIDTTKSGDYDITVVATDGAMHETTATTKIKVLEKPKPVITYFAYYNSSFDSMNNHNNEKNATLTDEEKSSLRYQVAEFSKQFVGNPYVYGGTSLTNGADCSGFTMSIYANFGYQLPRGSLDQAYIGTPVDAGSLLPGDLVVYYGHVGIYVGGGMMVHASTPEGGIKYAPMYDGYRVYRRIIN